MTQRYATDSADRALYVITTERHSTGTITERLEPAKDRAAADRLYASRSLWSTTTVRRATLEDAQRINAATVAR